MVLSRFGGGSDERSCWWAYLGSFNSVGFSGQFFNYFDNINNGTRDFRTISMLTRCTLGNTVLFIALGTNDTIQTFTWENNAIATAKVITVPALAGAASYTDTTIINFVALDRQSIIFAGGGAGTAAVRGCTSLILY